MSAPDRYDEAIAYLTNAVHLSGWRAICVAWANPEAAGGCLFAIAGPDPLDLVGEYDGCVYGCLTTVRQGTHVAPTPELTEAIRADVRIPQDAHEITLEHLPVFAEWQRRLDTELERTWEDE